MTEANRRGDHVPLLALSAHVGFSDVLTGTFSSTSLMLLLSRACCNVFPRRIWRLNLDKREQLPRMSVRELRELLASKNVNYADCFEKKDLVDRCVRMNSHTYTRARTPSTRTRLSTRTSMRTHYLRDRLC